MVRSNFLGNWYKLTGEVNVISNNSARRRLNSHATGVVDIRDVRTAVNRLTRVLDINHVRTYVGRCKLQPVSTARLSQLRRYRLAVRICSE